MFAFLCDVQGFLVAYKLELNLKCFLVHTDLYSLDSLCFQVVPQFPFFVKQFYSAFSNKEFQIFIKV